MVDKDKPRVTMTHSDLDSEVETPSAFVYTTKASKRVTFPDLYDMEADAGEKFLQELRSVTDGVFLRKWLPAEDLKALNEDKLTLRVRQALMSKVISYYEGTAGDEGEGDASAS